MNTKKKRKKQSRNNTQKIYMFKLSDVAFKKIIINMLKYR